MAKQTTSRNIEPDIINALKKQSEIVFISYSIIASTENSIKFALGKILEAFDKNELLTPIFSCIKELVSNATKANAKQILVKEGVIKETDGTVEVVNKIRTILNEEALFEYGIKCKESRLSTRTYLKVRNKNLIIEIINNLPLSGSDLARIQDRIEKSSKYDNIAEFYLENPDPAAEGMGLGLSMVVVLLKSININYKNFTVSTDGKEKTIARLIIPLV